MNFHFDIVSMCGALAATEHVATDKGVILDMLLFFFYIKPGGTNFVETMNHQM
uniref:Uncharacterized protein n=1 Tax=Arundo donax TaxID=35708 RepID=A0A0A9B8S7_ARUDO